METLLKINSSGIRKSSPGPTDSSVLSPNTFHFKASASFYKSCISFRSCFFFILVWQHSSCPYPGCLEIPANDWTDPPPAWFYHRFQGFFISRQNCLHSSPPPQVQTTQAGFLSMLKHFERIIPKLSETKLLNLTTFNIVRVNAILSNYWRCTSTNSRENPNGLSWS